MGQFALMLESSQNSGFCSGSTGLVYSSTSSGGDDLITRSMAVPAGAICLDTAAGRLRRMRSSVMTWARISDQWTSKTGFRYRPLFLTLTYADAASWEPKAISHFLKRLETWRVAMQRVHGCSIRVPYVWTLELQKRGAVHYHLIVWLPAFLYFPAPDKGYVLRGKRGRARVCAPMWPHGCSNTVVIKFGAAPYIAKYVSKGPCATGEEIPGGARVHGFGGVPRQSIEAREARWWRMPAWMRDHLPISGLTMVAGLARRAVSVLKARVIEPVSGRLAAFLSESGELFASPWAARFCRITGRMFVWRIDYVGV